MMRFAAIAVLIVAVARPIFWVGVTYVIIHFAIKYW